MQRQRFGLRVLESGLSIVHSDADALWLRDPWPVLRAGDVVGDVASITAERIWGKPPSVVRSWGAASTQVELSQVESSGANRRPLGLVAPPVRLEKPNTQRLNPFL